MDDIKPVISDVAHPKPEQPEQTTPQVTETVEQPVENTDSSTVDTKTQSPVVASKDNSNLKMTIIIVLAVVVALVLIGVAYMAFMKQEVEAPAQSNDQPQQTTETDKVDAATIDQDTTEIDGIVNEIDEGADFPEGELDDSNLGL